MTGGINIQLYQLWLRVPFGSQGFDSYTHSHIEIMCAYNVWVCSRYIICTFSDYADSRVQILCILRYYLPADILAYLHMQMHLFTHPFIFILHMGLVKVGSLLSSRFGASLRHWFPNDGYLEIQTDIEWWVMIFAHGCCRSGETDRSEMLENLHGSPIPGMGGFCLEVKLWFNENIQILLPASLTTE